MTVASLVRGCAVGTAVLLATGSAFAQAGNTAGTAESTATVGDVQLFIGERLWFATWQQRLFDAQIVIPSPTSPAPVLQTGITDSLSSTTTLPLTAFGLRYKGFTVSATVLPSTRFTSEGVAAGGNVGRSEADLSVSYAFSPNLAASIVYKSGTIDQGSTARAVSILGLSGGYTIKGLLFGLSASAPLQGSLALYGNVAIGPAKEHVNAAGFYQPDLTGLYQIGELGLAYRLTDERPVLGFRNMSVQVGYRAQVVTINDLALNSYSTGPVPGLVGSTKTNVQSTTQGFVLGIVAAF